ncbi:MAG: type II 3-dehydroquinate dehydratase [Alphaproteobacteria bacterium]|nr:type II 3-dehydroquinate dehydratase [Alphaproteobacteria bacterium]
MPRILILNGPNLNLLGTREPEIYGTETLADIQALCEQYGKQHDTTIDFRQTNHEGEMVEWIHAAQSGYSGVIINAGAYTHTSIAIHDALLALKTPIIEVHLSNIYQREVFRHHSYISGVAKGVICGFGSKGYLLALQALL